MAAIYQPKIWNQFWLTTTPYPVEYAEGLVVGAAPLAGRMVLVPSDTLSQTHVPVDMTYIQTRWYLEDGPYDDEIECTHDVVDMTYVQERWYLEDGPYDDLLECTHIIVDMTYIRIKVEADTPDEGLEFALTIRPTCTMDAV